MPELIGSIVAYGGEVEGWDGSNDWLPCNGRELDKRDYPALFVAIGFAWGGDAKRGTFNVPNLQGYFLRGVDQSGDQLVDKDSGARFAGPSGGNRGAKVGSLQHYATARPPPPASLGAEDLSFKTDVAGDHTHRLLFQLNAGRDVDNQDNTVAYPGPETEVPVGRAGAHEHVIISGGNKETRPVNANVHWIIRCSIDSRR